MNVLSIGNSFSQDAQRYLHRIAKADGCNLNTFNLYIGGCPLSLHYRNMISEERRAKYIVEVPVMKSVTREESGIIDARTPLQIKEDRIVELKTMLFDTDYKAIKYAEGLISEEEYEIIKRQRQAWRNEINMLEEGGV